MQNKGAIRLFAIILGLVCIYQISFTFITRSVETDAREFAAGDTAKERNYLDSIKNEKVFNLGIYNYTYQECKARELVLGLDLQGGMNITLEVSTVDLVKTMSNNSTDPDFLKAIALAQTNQAKSDKDFVTLFGEAWKTVAPGKRLASPSIFGNAANKDKIDPYKSTDDDVLKVLTAEADAAIDRTFQVLRTRIDKFGVASPNIQKLGNSGRILVELPGVKDKGRVRKLLQGSANLEFWETYQNEEMAPYMQKANDMLRLIAGGDTVATMQDTAAVADTSKAAQLAAAKKDSADKAQAAAKLDSNKKAAADTAGLSEDEQRAKFAKENPLYAVLNPNIGTNEAGQQVYVDGAAFGIAEVKDTAKVNKYLNLPSIRALFPADFRPYWAAKSKTLTNGKLVLELFSIRVTSNDGAPALSGEVIIDARADYQQNSSEAQVSMQLNGEGSQRWKRLTAENKGKAIAIVLDGYVYSAPNVINEIPNGSSQITGNFKLDEAKDLANVLKAGKMPAPARIVQDVVVGPSLGQKAINDGFASFIIALGLILVFMGFYYSNSGWVADIALFVNIFFMMGVLTSIGAVLTLPGIAGIVLTVGMSVDANVLIYERIREELRHGKGIRLAIADGYKMAYSSIVDSNVTTLIVGVVLFINGTGPIQGFATTLVIGILTSLFTAIFISRLVFEFMLGRNMNIKFSTKLTENAFKNIKFNWIGNRRIFYGISIAITLAGIVSLATRGLSYGIDFKGGRSYVVSFDKAVETTTVAEALAKPFGGNAPEVKTFGEQSQVKITTKYRIDDKTENVSTEVEDLLKATLTAAMPANKLSVESSDMVGPTVADDIKRSSVWSFLFAVAGIFLYIVVRFRKWEFGLGAVISLLHDSFMLISVFSIFYGILPFSLEIDQAFIAAILTVMGYSINDTVVVFDRIREYLNENKKAPDMKVVINDALNATISRTILTSLTIFLVLFAIFIFGGEVIRGFSFALLVGVVVGTYSSLCIATPISVDLNRKRNKAIEDANKKAMATK